MSCSQDRKPAGVLCCGNAVLDILVRPVAEPGWGKTTWVDSIEQGLGGNGGNTSFALARLGVPTRLLSAVGEDAFGERVLSILGAEGVDTRWIARLPLPTPTTVVLVRPDGVRALLHQPGASGEAFSQPIEMNDELAEGCSRFHLGNVFALQKLQPHAAGLLQRAKGHGLQTSVDTGWDTQGRWMAILGDCLLHTDLLFVNEDEAGQLTGMQNPDAAARVLQEHGAQTVVIKMGASGCLVAHGGEQFHVPAFQVPVVDTTGAGDCFAGGFLAALQRGTCLREAARFANAVGALSVRALGGTTGLLTYDGTREWVSAHLAGNDAD